MIRKPYVLIIEDDAWLAEQHVRTLLSEGIEADYVEHAFAAMTAIDQRQPIALILDVLLPGPNAFTLLHELRSYSDLASIPVILCTNSADHLAEEDVAVYGVVRVLDKTTMLPRDLVGAVRKAVL